MATYLMVEMGKAPVDAVLRTAIYGENFGRAFKQAATGAMINGVSGYAAHRLGKLYDRSGQKDLGLNYVTHKLAHGVVGGVLGGIVGKLDGKEVKASFITGAYSAMLVEIFAELFQGDPTTWLDGVDQEAQAKGYGRGSAEYNALLEEKIRTLADLSKLSTALVTLLAGQDVEISLQAATNAVENNFISSLTEYYQTVLDRLDEDEQEAYEAGHEDRDTVQEEERGRSRDRESSRSRRSKSPPRVKDTFLQEKLQQVQKELPDWAKEIPGVIGDVVQTGYEFNTAFMLPVVKEACDHTLEKAGECLDVAATGLATGMRRILRDGLGVDQGVAQDISDLIKHGTPYMIPSAAAPKVITTLSNARKVATVGRVVRTVEGVETNVGARAVTTKPSIGELSSRTGLTNQRTKACEHSIDTILPVQERVIQETLSQKGNFSSSVTLSSEEALNAGIKFVGPEYKEIGKSGSGVYHSLDGTREFRIDIRSIEGAHAPNVPHVHFGVKDPVTGQYISDNHVQYKD